GDLPAQPFAEPCGLVLVARAGPVGDVDLLQGDHVGLERGDLARGASEVDPPVPAQAMADVVRRDPPARHAQAPATFMSRPVLRRGSLGPGASSARRTARPTGSPRGACPAA